MAFMLAWGINDIIAETQRNLIWTQDSIMHDIDQCDKVSGMMSVYTRDPRTDILGGDATR